MKAKVIEKRKEAPLMSKHKFWSTQPVMQFDELDKEDMAIGPIKKVDPKDIPSHPYPLPEELEWCSIDEKEFTEATFVHPSIEEFYSMEWWKVYEIMRDYFIEDYDSAYRMKYSFNFLKWVFTIPGYYPEFLYGIRVKATKELVAFASSISGTVSIGDTVLKVAIGNYTAIKTPYRSKRLTPLISTEYLRRMQLRGIYQYIFSIDRVVFALISEMWCHRRALNYRKMLDVSASERL
eukprot:TRINITY_DN6131_c0_g1_i7.p1 TRINITY_DN6131_c0_g1~~TRINITY_DN6131_c0_g1_i7.p1  ORF type:complete len:236 (-),score=54.43 TRINITY_DN6131_c0_g1_i7:273-980(-)